MLLGLFAVTASVGIELMEQETGEKVTDVSASVGELPKVQGSVPPTAAGGGGGGAIPTTTVGGGGGGGGGGGLPTTTSTTTTTIPPTTTQPCTVSGVSPLNVKTSGRNSTLDTTSFSVTVSASCSGKSITMKVNGKSWGLTPNNSTSRSTGSLSSTQRSGFATGNYTVTFTNAQGSFTLKVSK